MNKCKMAVVAIIKAMRNPDYVWKLFRYAQKLLDRERSTQTEEGP